MTRGIRLWTWQAVAAGALGLLWACGGGGSGGSSVTGPGGNPGGGAPGPSGATITIANGRVSPSAVTISTGQSVTFVNNDGRARNVTSDPHPLHTDCPAINAVGTLNNGQTRLTHALTVARTCGFHNHDDPDNSAFRGQIVVQ